MTFANQMSGRTAAMTPIAVNQSLSQTIRDGHLPEKRKKLTALGDFEKASLSWSSKALNLGKPKMASDRFSKGLPDCSFSLLNLILGPFLKGISKQDKVLAFQTKSKSNLAYCIPVLSQKRLEACVSN